MVGIVDLAVAGFVRCSVGQFDGRSNGKKWVGDVTLIAWDGASFVKLLICTSARVEARYWPRLWSISREKRAPAMVIGATEKRENAWKANTYASDSDLCYSPISHLGLMVWILKFIQLYALCDRKRKVHVGSMAKSFPAFERSIMFEGHLHSSSLHMNTMIGPLPLQSVSCLRTKE